MTIQRQSIVKGPALIQWETLNIITQGDVVLQLNATSFEVQVDGAVWDERDDDCTATITATPLGVFSTAMVAALLPWLNVQPGTGMYGTVDKPIVIHGRDGKKYTFASAAISVMPEVTFAANAQLWGQATWKCIRANNTAASVAESFYKPEEAVFPTLAMPSRADVPTMPYAVSLGAAGDWTAIKPADGGVKLSWELNTEDVISDALGTTQTFINGLRATVAFSPLTHTADQVLGLFVVQGAGAVRGRSRFSDAKDLTIDGGAGNPICVVKNVLPVENPSITWGPSSRRLGELQFRTVRDITGSTYGAVATLGVKPTE